MNEKSWERYQELVLSDLRALKNSHATIQKQLVKIHVSIGELNLKSGAWGALGGILAIVILLGIEFLSKK